MKLQLRSDFRDFYDHMFDRDGDVMERFTRTDMHRRDAFDLLASAGYRVPPHGTAASINQTFLTTAPEGWTVVAYDDPFAHRGEGKRKAGVNTLPPDTYCSLFIKSTTPVSYRHLWIGQMCVALCYTSDDSWRSNVGNVSIVSVGMSYDMKRPASLDEYPLVAIDILPDPATGRMENGYAVDLNTAPGLGGEIRDLMSATNVVQYIKEYWYGRKARRL